MGSCRGQTEQCATGETLCQDEEFDLFDVHFVRFDSVSGTRMSKKEAFEVVVGLYTFPNVMLSELSKLNLIISLH